VGEVHISLKRENMQNKEIILLGRGASHKEKETGSPPFWEEFVWGKDGERSKTLIGAEREKVAFWGKKGDVIFFLRGGERRKVFRSGKGSQGRTKSLGRLPDASRSLSHFSIKRRTPSWGKINGSLNSP